MWVLKNKTTNKQKASSKYAEQIGDRLREMGWGVGTMGERGQKVQLLAIE